MNNDEDPIKQLSLDDFLSHPETEEILEREFFEKFNNHMYDIIISFYEKEVDKTTYDFIDVFDKDFLKEKGNDFFHTIYPYISKQYDIDIFDKFPNLADPLFIIDETNKKKTENKTFESKEFDWGRKTDK